MKSQIRFGLGVLIFLSMHGAFAQDLPVLPAPADISKLPNPAGFDSSTRTEVGRRSPGGLAAQRADRRGGVPVEIDIDKLTMPTSPDAASVSFAGSSSSAPSTLTVNLDRPVDLIKVAESADPEFAFRHMTFKIAGSERGYARISVAPNALVATLVTPRSAHRILGSRSGPSVAHALGDGGGAQRFKRFSPGADDALSILEQRHIQLERLAEVQPARAYLNWQGRSLLIEDGQLGAIGDAQDPAEILEVLDALASLTRAPENLRIAIERVQTRPEGKVILFHQVIDGIPLWQTNRVELDTQGRVRSVRTQLFDPALAQKPSIASETEAMAIAVRAVEDLLKRRVSEYELFKPTTLSYKVLTPKVQLVPAYSVYVRDIRNGGVWAVSVDASTGHARILATPEEFGWRVCTVGTAGASPDDCSDPGTFQVYYHDYGSAEASKCAYRSPPKDDGPCKQYDGRSPEFALRVANEHLDGIEDQDPTLCCSDLGGNDRIVDVVYQTPAAGNLDAGYFPSESIMSRPGSTLLRLIEVVWHEVGHHVLYKLAKEYSFADKYGTGEPFVDAFVESYGDLFSAGMAAVAPPPAAGSPWQDAGQVWIHRDGAISSGPTRVLNDPNLTSFYHLTTHQTTPHEAGRAISKYFYQVQQQAGIPSARFVKLLLQVAQKIKDHGNNGLDLIDMRQALRDSAVNEPVLLAAIDSQFDAMYNSIPPNPGGPPPIGVPGIPPPPFPIAAVPTGACPVINGAVTSEWRVDWGHPAYATYYYATIRVAATGQIRDTRQLTDLWIIAQTNVDAIVAVQGCNNANLCGPAAQVSVGHRPECTH